MPMTAHASRATSPRAATLLPVAAVAVLAGGCSAGNLVASCTAPQSLSVVVTVRDSISGSAAADNAIGTLVGVRTGGAKETDRESVAS